MAAESRILTINGGSSSIRFALFAAEEALQCLGQGKVERIGLAGCRRKTELGSAVSGRQIVPDNGTHSSRTLPAL